MSGNAFSGIFRYSKGLLGFLSLGIWVAELLSQLHHCITEAKCRAIYSSSTCPDLQLGWDEPSHATGFRIFDFPLESVPDASTRFLKISFGMCWQVQDAVPTGGKKAQRR